MPGETFGDGWDLSQLIFAKELLKYVFCKALLRWQFPSFFMIILMRKNQFSEILLAQPTLKEFRHAW
jgi:hypothetical protein